MRFLDCVNSNIFDNYWYLDGLSDKMGYLRFKQIRLQGSVIEVSPDSPSGLTTWKIIITFGKLLSMLTLLIPAIMITGKFVYRLTHIFFLSEKQLEISERISVGTYNLLFPQKIVNGAPSKSANNIGFGIDVKGNPFENSAFRTEIIAKNILSAACDVVVLQEVTDNIANDLKSSFKDLYEFKWVKHQNYHGVGIIYKKDKFLLLNEDILSIHVQMEDALNPGYYQPSPTRAHLLVDLKDQVTKRIFRFISCHMFDPSSLQNKEEQTNKVIDFAENKPADYVVDRIIIAGDMSQDQFGDASSPNHSAMPSEKLAPSFQPLIEKEYYVDGNLESTEYDRKAPGNGKIFSKNRHVDWIWVKKCRPEHLPLSDFDRRGSHHALTASIIC